MAASQSNETYTARRMHLPYHYSAVTDDTCLDVTPALFDAYTHRSDGPPVRASAAVAAPERVCERARQVQRAGEAHSYGCTAKCVVRPPTTPFFCTYLCTVCGRGLSPRGGQLL